MRAAEGAHRGEAEPVRHVLRGAHPLVGARDIVGAFARPEEAAERPFDDGEVGDLARAHGGQRFVEEEHPLLDPIGEDEGEPEPSERLALDVGIVEAPADGHRLT